MTCHPPGALDNQDRLRAAIGQAVLSAAKLEHTLRVLIMGLRGKREGISAELVGDVLAMLDKPAGRLRRELKRLDVDGQLLERIREVAERRNRLIHHPLEVEALVWGLVGENVQNAIDQVNQITADCDAIEAELRADAYGRVLDLVGVAPNQLPAWLASHDPNLIEDEGLRISARHAHALFSAHVSANESAPPAARPTSSGG